MGMLSIGGVSAAWNYHDPDKEGFSEEITGTIVAVQPVQVINFDSRQPEFWPDGKPKLNVKYFIKLEDGTEKTWVINPARDRDRTDDMVDASDWNKSGPAVLKAMRAAGIPATDWGNIGGYMVGIATTDDRKAWIKPKNKGGAARPWFVQVLGKAPEGTYRGELPFESPTAQQQEEQPQAQPVQQQAANPVSFAMNKAKQATAARPSFAVSAAPDEQVPYSDADIPF